MVADARREARCEWSITARAGINTVINIKMISMTRTAIKMSAILQDEVSAMTRRLSI
jgi:hypothetical protein